ncbi:PAS domain-containing protein [Phaeobacter sp. CECT 5382]|uniref:PAS domain-containing protein n=1 Tax=Phaeobacter sp. CECT 5382 TaxID=1712645 RepID=UPI0012E3D50C|nr:PAS domain-containing protein [Phaeobacter sp. CECT 5382]
MIDRTQATIQFDPKGTILTANGNFLAAMGYALEEIKGQHHSIFVETDIPQVERPPAHLAAVLRSYQASCTHGAVVRASDARTAPDFRSRGRG